MTSPAIAGSVKNALISKRASLIATAALMLVLILGLGLLSVSYVDAAFYLVGIAVALPVLVLGALLRERSGALGWRQWTLPITVLALVTAAAVTASLRQQPNPAVDVDLPLGGPLPITALGYALHLEPADARAQSFEVILEEVSLADNPQGYLTLSVSHPAEITSRTAGVLRRQVRLDSLLSRAGDATLVLEDGSNLQVRVEPWHGSLMVKASSGEPLPDGAPDVIVMVCGRSRSCAPWNVELTDMPKGAFQKVAAAHFDSIDTFDDTEKITWQLGHPSDEIAFSYVEPRYRWFYPAVKPFLSLSSLGHLAMFLFGVVGPAIGVSILKPALVAVATEALKNRLRGVDGATWIRRLFRGPGIRARKPPRPRKRRGRR